MITIFERIPDLFVQQYDYAFQTWAREFRTRGRQAAIAFKRLPGTPALLDSEGREVVRGAWFEAEPVDGKMIIRPASDFDAEMVERHVREMQPHILQ